MAARRHTHHDCTLQHRHPSPPFIRFNTLALSGRPGLVGRGQGKGGAGRGEFGMPPTRPHSHTTSLIDWLTHCCLLPTSALLLPWPVCRAPGRLQLLLRRGGRALPSPSRSPSLPGRASPLTLKGCSGPAPPSHPWESCTSEDATRGHESRGPAGTADSPR
ncbi:hypothetical protein E2C01_063937 [Portunus trituberculatus]|uniref:Uncharacterized protein n=1 Tax=Portunus trituberculatus TaxID=210409 RepID=A0A5B7HKD7_PORTR|nr:hypothetical protein [Portunus trituberculatus]